MLPAVRSDLCFLSLSPQSNGHGESPCGGQVVVIHMKPDDQGRYGFNVKGGAESSTPITVSKVAPNAPADRATPRLSEGDQVSGPTDSLQTSLCRGNGLLASKLTLL